ncbi:MAG: sialidase family protein [Cyclobacteriaceae bacterium]
MKIVAGWYTVIFLLGFLISPQASHAIGIFQQDTTNHPSPFGMRLRDLPPQNSKIYAPVFVQESPGNEATLVRLADGMLKIFFVNRPGDADKLMSIASKDGGLTWDESRIAFDLPGQAYYANQVIEDEHGELHCVFHLFDKGENGYRGRHLNLWYCKTQNQQERWTKPRKIFDGYVGSIRSLMQLKNGRLLMAFAKAVPERSEAPPEGTPDYGWNDVISMFSDDGGITWQFSKNNIKIAADKPNNTRYGGVEPALTELKDGRVWMLIRTRLGHLYESYSLDAGASWQPPRRTNFISSDSPATTLRLSDGRIVMFFCSNQRWDDPRSYAMGGREVLHASISADEGKTWKGFREVLVVSPLGSVKGDRGTSYPSAAETKHGKIALIAGQGEAQRAIVLLDPAWLEETSQTDDFPEGLMQWTLFGADNLTSLKQIPGKKQVHALLIRKSPSRINHDTEAVWNFPMSIHGELEMQIVKNSGSKGMHLALTDHFSISEDTAASQNSVVNFILKEGDANNLWKKGETRMTIKINWNTQDGKAVFYANGKQVAVRPFQRKPNFGLNYLRLGIPGSTADTSGFYVESIRFNSLDKR